MVKVKENSVEKGSYTYGLMAAVSFMDTLP
jgi:hypothetical protein